MMKDVKALTERSEAEGVGAEAAAAVVERLVNEARAVTVAPYTNSAE